MGKREKVKDSSPVHYNSDSPLDRIQGESIRANSAFRDYVLMGPGRSIKKLCDSYAARGQSVGKEGVENYDEAEEVEEVIEKPPTTRLQTLETWSTRFAWQARLETWDVIRAREESRQWAERRERHREEEWKLRDKLVDVAERILEDVPNYIKRSIRVLKNGDQVITEELDGNFLLKNIELASKLGRLAADMETERKKHEHSGQIAIPATNVSEMDDEQLRLSLSKLGNIASALAAGDDLRGDNQGTADGDPEGEAEAGLDA